MPHTDVLVRMRQFVHGLDVVGHVAYANRFGLVREPVGFAQAKPPVETTVQIDRPPVPSLDRVQDTLDG